MTKALVDTEIWSLAKKKPVRSRFSSEAEYERAMKMHSACKKFFEEEFDRIRVYMSLHQVAEIFHVLSFRGSRLPAAQALEIVTEIFGDEGSSFSGARHGVCQGEPGDGNTRLGFPMLRPGQELRERCLLPRRALHQNMEMYGKELVNPAEEWLEL